jgi:hypothetical protein
MYRILLNFIPLMDYLYCLRIQLFLWVGVLVCGFRAARPEETPPTRRIAVQLGQAERLGYGAETKRPTGHGHETLVMSSLPDWKR